MYTKNVHNEAGTRQLVLPSNDPLVTWKAVASTLTFSTYYNIDGTQQYMQEPAAGGLAAETVDFEYNSLGLNTRTGGAVEGRLTWLAADDNGTSTVAVDATSSARGRIRP